MSKIFKAKNIIFDEKVVNIESRVDLEDTEEFAIDNKVDEVKAVESEKTTQNLEIKKEEILSSAKKEAEKILKRAQKEAEEFVKQKSSEAFQEKEKILEDSRKEGFTKGYQEGLDEVNKLKDEANEIYEAALEKKNELIKEIEPELIELIVDVSKKILNTNLEANPQLIVNLIGQGLNESTLTGEVYIRVSKDYYDIVIENKDEVLKKVDSSTKVDILKDLSLKGADCVIETPFGNIDCSLDEQLNVLKESLHSIL